MKLVFPWHPGLQHLSSCMVMYCKPREFYKQRHGRAWLCSWPSYPGAPVAAIWAVWWLNLPPLRYFHKLQLHTWPSTTTLRNMNCSYYPEPCTIPLSKMILTGLSFRENKVLETLEVIPEIRKAITKNTSRSAIEKQNKTKQPNPKEQCKFELSFRWRWVWWGSGFTWNTTPGPTAPTFHI